MLLPKLRATWRFGSTTVLNQPCTFHCPWGGGAVFGVLAFNVIGRERDWPIDLVNRLQLLAQMFANALARKRADELLRESEARYRGIFEGAIEGMYRTSLQGKSMVANPAMAKMLGYDSAEDVVFAVEDSARQVWADLDERSRFVRLLQEQEVVRGYECQFKRKDGTRIWGSLNSQAVRGPDGQVACFEGFVEDITERKRAGEEVQQQRRELAHLSRLTMLGELSGSLAHELNHPLTAILSNAQAAQRFLAHDKADLNEVRDILRDIVDEDKRAGEVIHRLRLLLKKGEMQHQQFDLNEVVREVLKLVRSDLVNQSVTVHTELAPALPAVNTDRVQLQQVLLNLVMNACDAMAGGPAGDRKLIIRTGLAEGEGIRVSVADRGVALAPDKLEKVFAPFFTTKGHGMGLGLSVCRTIITAHGGKLWAANNPERGATFHFTLPASEEGQGAGGEWQGARKEQGSGFGVRGSGFRKEEMSTYRRLEDLVVYQKLCQLHIDVCALTHRWPTEEKYELGSQARRSSNSSPA